jgi:type IV pilus assembly protein PilA
MSDDDGFTLIEVLSVILVIGVLAAIALPMLIGQRGRAQDAGGKSDANMAMRALERFATDRPNGYENAAVADLVAEQPTLRPLQARGRIHLTGLATSAPGKGDYVVAVVSDSGSTFAYAKDPAGAMSGRFCTPAGTGGCGKAIPGMSFAGVGNIGAW